MFVKGLIVYGWGLIVSMFLIMFIACGLYQLSTYACCLIALQILLLFWIVVETVLEIRRGTNNKDQQKEEKL